MSAVGSAQPIFLAQRSHVVELLRNQQWADRQLHFQLKQAECCLALARGGRLTPSALRETISSLAMTMHQALQEYATSVKALFQPGDIRVPTLNRVRVNSSHVASLAYQCCFTHWPWPGTHPAAGSLVLSSHEHSALRDVAELWTHRCVHRVLSLRAMGEFLLRADLLNNAERLLVQSRKQLCFATEDFWTHFSLAEMVGVRRENSAEVAD